MAKSWKDSDLDYLKRYAASKTLKQLAQRFGADDDAVAAKLGELELTSKDGKPEGAGADPVVELYEEGLKALYAGSWKKAASKLEKVVAEGDQVELQERARQLLVACRRHLAEGEGAEVDPYDEAVMAKNRGDRDTALELCKRGGRSKKDERFAFLAASVMALAGDPDGAAEALAQAIELEPKNRVHAFHDPDFAPLRADREHAHLFGLD
jgi:tetratricopeptide (TPR) repeat protein